MIDYQREAERAVRQTANIPDFAYHGDLPIGETWAFTVSKHRDSSVSGTSNYDVILADMQKRFPRSVDEVRASHWAVGWIAHLAVRMLDKQGRVTKAGAAILDWNTKLEDYPVADEEALAAAEYEAAIESLMNWSSLPIDGEMAERIHAWLGDHGRETSSDHMRDRDVQEAYNAIAYSEFPPEVVAVVLKNSNDEDAANLFDALRTLREEYQISARDLVRLVRRADELEVDLTDLHKADMLVEQMGFHPEDTVTMPMFPGLKGLRCRRRT